MKKRVLFASVIFVFLSTYTSKINNSLDRNIKIEKITIENNKILDDQTIKKKISFLYEENLFFLNNKKIISKLQELDLIDSIEIKKIYPNQIKVKIFEKQILAIIQNKKEKNYYTNKGLINYKKLNGFEDLPVVFGDNKSFEIFYNDLEKIDFPISDIKKFYLFESKRWDIITLENQIIKLPIKNYDLSLKNFIKLKNQTNFRKYKTFDYRINDQLILK